MHWQGKWIWTDTPVPTRNAFVRFRRTFTWGKGPALFHITADSRYVLYVNNRYIGQGPVRAWPAHWKYDSYDLQPYLHPGTNVIAVLVNHYGEGNFQYIPGPAGLLAQLESDQQCVLATDESWCTSVDPSFSSVAPRISVQEGFEEHVDARRAENWTACTYSDTEWQPAIVVANPGDPPHTSLEPRDIPQLTLEPIQPVSVLDVESVRSLPHRWHLHIKPYLHPTDIQSNHVVHHAYVFTQIWSQAEAQVHLVWPHHERHAVKINGQKVEHRTAQLQPGWNQILIDYRGRTHLQTIAFVIDGPVNLRFACRGPEGGTPWAIVGPFDLTPALEDNYHGGVDTSALRSEGLHPEATAVQGEAIWEAGTLDAAMQQARFFQEMKPEHLPEDSFIQSYTDLPVTSQPRVENLQALLSGNHEWTIVYPDRAGDVRLLLDFGKEVVGFHHFEVDGAAGTVLDWHNFEFIQPDGRYNFAEGMNNSFRYILKDGPQEYQTYVRRGFRYSYLTIRNQHAPLRIRLVEVLFNTYPQTRQGTFACSQAQLDRIWHIGAHSLRCCAEDTYVDCPTYEQTHWVGDARNEALVDWVVNGDSQLWYRCLEQAGQSLERSPLTESHVPSAWQNILPAWSFLWMRSCREYLLYTGDTKRSMLLLAFIRRNVDGIRQHLNSDGLFDIRAWNMFDWAAMDTPSRGVVTHQNCFAVLALGECAQMAQWLGATDDASAWQALADSLASAINAHLWNDTHQAYTDCLRDGKQSTVYSQQTQTVAYMSRVAIGERAAACRRHMHNPPEGFVRAGSPFFEFFMLEALAEEGRDAEFLATMERDWGFMVDKGASTFWEMWSYVLPGGRLTRSHCHGWSAAPTFFLSTHVLGVKPLSPGYASVEIAPKPGGLSWCRGTIPTPHGIIKVQWEDHEGQPFRLRVDVPDSVQPVINTPRPAIVILNGVQQEQAS